MTTDERRAYMREYMRAYRTTHRDHLNRLDRAARDKRKMTTPEQETAKRVIISLGEIVEYLSEHNPRGGLGARWFFALGYAIATVEPDTHRAPLDEGFGTLVSNLKNDPA